MVGMEELTVNLTRENREKEESLTELRASITEKDVEIAQTIIKVEQNSTHMQERIDKEREQST